MKDQGINSEFVPMIQIKAMDAPAAYGKQTMKSTTEIINSPGIDNQFRNT